MEIHLQHLLTTSETGKLYFASYNSAWVAVSVLLSIFASYAALAAASRIKHQPDFRSKLTWMVISAFTMGIGVWAMHFIGMLALKVAHAISYDPFLTLLSMAPAVLAAAIALSLEKPDGAALIPPCHAAFC